MRRSGPASKLSTMTVGQASDQMMMAVRSGSNSKLLIVIRMTAAKVANASPAARWAVATRSRM